MSDGERRWLTYAEIGEALGIKASSAKRLSFRRRWPHRAGNDSLARVGVPVVELRRTTGDRHRVVPGDDSGTVPGGATGDEPDGAAALVLALDRIETLAGQVAHLRGELAQAARGRAAAEAAMADARCRAEAAEGTALDAWRLAAELVARLAAARPPAAPRRRGGFVARLLGW